MRKADPREKIPVAVCHDADKGLERELQTFQDNIKELRSVNETNTQTKHYVKRAEWYARNANILSIAAIILSIIGLIIRLLVIKG